MSDIFISYAREDRPRAEAIAKALEEHGWSVWWDWNIPAETFRQCCHRKQRAWTRDARDARQQRGKL
jgi:hypothetical protein